MNYVLRRRRFHHWRYVDAAVRTIRNLVPDVVICTGDLTNIGDPAEFDKACTALRPLVDDERFELLYVPGNHDNYVANRSCRTALETAFQYMNRGRWEMVDLPLATVVGPVRFLLVNQTHPAPVYASYGTIDEKTLRWFKEDILEDPGVLKTNVLVGHFPLFNRNGQELPARRRCRGNRVFQDALRKNFISLSLCGHIHQSFVRTEPNGSMEICAGSLTLQGRLNVIELCGDHPEVVMAQEWHDV